MPRLVIVGGGSAGWITASYINSVANKEGPTVDIVLVESPDIGRIGVGEATVPSIRETLSRIGIPEREFLASSEGTFKNAIAFQNWLRNEGEVYFHPFDHRQVNGRSDTVAKEWLASARNVPWADTVSVMKHLCDAGRAPKAANWPDYASVFPYAYHMDAEKFADALSVFSTARGVRHVQARVESVDVAAGDLIRSVLLDTGETLAGDLFIDCTGFAALLIGKALGGQYVDFGDWLLCDRAVAMPVPYDVYQPERLQPYTMSSALSSGWAWDIPLRTRRGRGYVYCSRFLDAKGAEAELKAEEGAHASGLPVRHLEFRVGHRAQPWIGNCIAIGLSAGFIEPLESSALYTVEASIAALLEHVDFAKLGDAERTDVIRRSFNANITRLFQEILEFVNLHYCLTRRDDTPFWREVGKPEHVVPALAERLALWACKAPTQYDFASPLQLFSLASYEYIMFGMDFPPDRGERPTALDPRLVEQVEKSKAKLPEHAAWFGAPPQAGP